MDNPTDNTTQKDVFELGLNAELLKLAVIDGEWLDAAEKLTVYKESAMLLSEICTLTRQFNKCDRAFAEELRGLGIKLMSLIYMANHQRRDSTAQMREALEALTFQRMLCRICVYQRMMSKKHYAQIAPRFDTIGRMLSGWIKVTEQMNNNKK